MNKPFKKLGYNRGKDGTIQPFVFQPFKKIPPPGTIAQEYFDCPNCGTPEAVSERLHSFPRTRLLACMLVMCPFWTFDTKEKRHWLVKERKRRLYEINRDSVKVFMSPPRDTVDGANVGLPAE